ncbi:glycosyltransferase family 4 protein [Bifidobacterium choerinum]|uniref:Phosphatidylinositol alpha-mannosyltransferase n=1 Tax=Bifidobacterium choerinum TaxID=35760 RepID=A0A087ADP4_9BIFI|nr:glycosyltransferase family 4 protein [Bifidobacterium choerinum]KFI56894.1 phosphatidylinositol alpha-mannosyltransferase [Bifidobacterium choerinum]
MPLTIGFVFDDTLDALDGVQQHIVTIGEELRRRGHDVHYLVGETHDSPVPNTHPLSRNVMVRFNGNRMRIPLPARRAAIHGVLAAHDFDILHVQAPYSPFLAGRVLREASPATGVVATYHIACADLAAQVGGRLLGLIDMQTHRRVDEVIAVSQVAARYAAATAHVRGVVIPNPVDVDRFADAARHARRDPQAPHVVFLGRLVERKGPMQLLDAIAYGERASILPAGLHVTIAGDGPLMCECRAKASRLRTPVEFLGTVDETKAALLASADVAAFPSLPGETFGIVLPEAIASGAGVTLAGDNPGYRWTMRGDEDALFPISGPDRARILAERIRRAIADPGWAHALHKRERALLARYDVAAVTDRVEEVYRRAIADRRR